MKKLFVTVLVAIFFVQSSWAQEDVAAKYAATIEQDDLKGLLEIIASDALEGRETGERGQKMAAAFIEAQFKSYGLQPVVETKGGLVYQQEVPLRKLKKTEAYLKIENEKYTHFMEMLFSGKGYTGGEEKMKTIFIADGSGEVLDKVDIKGKAVLLFAKDYWSWRPLRTKLQEMGARAVLVANTADEKEFTNFKQLYGRFFNRSSMTLETSERPDFLGTFYISKEIGSEILNTKVKTLEKSMTELEAGNFSAFNEIEPAEIECFVKKEYKKILSENVLGFLEGTDKKDEVIVVTAHYDHEGVKNGEIYNGADDDGSGTVAVLELAEAFSLAKEDGNGPRRSMLFMTVTGEERGLLGSKYYVENPVFSFEDTEANLNIDMIGRVDAKHEADTNYIYLVGADKIASELHDINERMNKKYTQFSIDYTHNDESNPQRIYYRSDHWNFAKNGIPVTFYYDGGHADYHKPTDTVEKIDFDLLQKRASLVFHTAWILANKDHRLVKDKFQEGGIQE